MNSRKITFKGGVSLNRPPLFEGEHFSFWQARMQIFIQSTDPGAWNAVLNGPHAPTKTVDGKDVSSKAAEEEAWMFCALFSYVHEFSSLIFLLVIHLQCLSDLDDHENHF